jgi:hypothetical protein
MHKTHEELAEAAARSIHGGDLSQGLNRRTIHIIRSAITAAAQAEWEQSRAVLETIRDQCAASYGTSHAIYKMAAAELARLVLNGEPTGVST